MTNFTKKSSMPQFFIFLKMNETFSAFMFNGHNHTKSHGIYTIENSRGKLMFHASYLLDNNK